LGSEYDLPFLIEKYQIMGGIVAIGDNWTRNLVVERVSKIVPEFKYVSVHIGAGSVVMPGAIINANAIVGNHCILNTNSSLDHDSFMDNFSSLAPKVCVGGNVIIGRASAICLGANIVANITIGEHSVIGAGSLVIRNISNLALVYGSPAKLIRKRIASEPYLAGKKNSSPRTTSRVVEKV